MTASDFVSQEDHALSINHFSKDYCSAHDLIHRRFEKVALIHSDRIAVSFEGQTLTYQELNLRANKVAHFLIRQNVAPDHTVALLFEPSLEMIIAMMGVLKAGAGYVPMEPKFPTKRIDFMIRDSGAQLILSSATHRGGIHHDSLVLIDDNIEIGECPEDNPEVEMVSTSLAYIIYTSGTTGRPKGVMIEHRNFISLVEATSRLFQFSETDSWTMFHSYCFDFSVWEVFTPLVTGGKVVVVPESIRTNCEKFYDTLIENNITVLNQTPSAFDNLMYWDILTSNPKALNLRYVIFGGEALTPINLKSWKLKYQDVKLINMYGITETTVHVTYKEITIEEIQANKCVIGRPISSLSSYVMDKYGNLQLPGATGILYIGGFGVARGYVNNPELSCERFIDNPHRRGEKLYNSGDIVELLSGGDMMYVQRVDNQVQIRGFRVELGEIESHLSAYSGVVRAVAAVKENHGHNILVAYYIAGLQLNPDDLKNALAGILPPYMIPSFFVRLDKIPLTQNCKVDRSALPDPQRAIEEDGRRPSNAAEERLAALWSAILKIDVGLICADKNFFELGGHSLSANQLLIRIQQEFNVKVSLPDLFSKPTIAELATIIAVLKENSVDVGTHVPFKVVKKTNRIKANPSQTSMFMAHRIRRHKVDDVMALYRVEGEVNVKRLNNAVRAVVYNHQSLRSYFVFQDGEVLQEIAETPEWNLTELTSESDSIDFVIANIQKQPVSYSSPSLVRSYYIRMRDGRRYFFILMPHIVCDGISLQLIIEEVIARYQGNYLPSTIPSQFEDFAEWQQQYFSSRSFQAAREFWLNQFPEMPLALNFKRLSIETKNDDDAQSYLVNVPDELFAELQGSIGDRTLFNVFLTAYFILLRQLTGNTEISIGVPARIATEPALNEVVGLLTNTIVLKCRVDGDRPISLFAKQVGDLMANALQNIMFPFSLLTANLMKDKGMAGKPTLFSAYLNYERIQQVHQLGETHLIHQIPGVRSEKLPLSLDLVDYGTHLLCHIKYQIKFFNEAGINVVFKNYMDIVTNVVRFPLCKISEVASLATGK